MSLFRSLLFNILLFVWTAAVVLFGLPALAIGRRSAYALARLWARGNFALLAHLVGLRHRILGRERLPPEPVIAAVKHQSAWDIMVCTLLFAEPAYVLKRELTWIPVFGWYLLRARMIAVDRRAGGAALRRMVRQARDAVADRRSILIYPEGTRTAPGTSGPYQRGVAALYEQLNLPVVPIALNSGLFWGRRSFRKRPGVITLEILEPIPPGLERRAFLVELHRRIEEAALRLAGEASSPSAASENATE
ncbi:MAG: lysophospholipid acyltransferase family protein [Pseudomonadota bacterium]